jgi:crotonobetainyl-CoA:carnitine CoA-transferase CaiB-like acyl-CoA transferase
MYDKTTHARVVADNYFWSGMTEDQLWSNVCRVWDKPQNCAVSHIKAGIAQLESRGILTSEEAAACLNQTLKTRAKAKREEVTA